MAATLETPRLRLHPIPPPLARAIAADPLAALRGLPAPPAPGWPSADLLEFLTGLGAADDEGPGAFLIVPRDEPRVVGDVGFVGPPDEAGDLEIGYGLVPSARGRGYATEAVAALVEHAFADPAVRRVVATTLPGNLPSARVLERCGFTPAERDPEHLRWALPRPRRRPDIER